jgi:hypothetical protein
MSTRRSKALQRRQQERLQHARTRSDSTACRGGSLQLRIGPIAPPARMATISCCRIRRMADVHFRADRRQYLRQRRRRFGPCRPVCGTIWVKAEDTDHPEESVPRLLVDCCLASSDETIPGVVWASPAITSACRLCRRRQTVTIQTATEQKRDPRRVGSTDRTGKSSRTHGGWHSPMLTGPNPSYDFGLGSPSSATVPTTAADKPDDVIVTVRRPAAPYVSTRDRQYAGATGGGGDREDRQSGRQCGRRATVGGTWAEPAVRRTRRRATMANRLSGGNIRALNHVHYRQCHAAGLTHPPMWVRHHIKPQ